MIRSRAQIQRGRSGRQTRPLDLGMLEMAAKKLGLDLTGWIADLPSVRPP
jgi:hypothetical protein